MGEMVHPAHNLPLPLDSFVGRTAEKAAIAERLRGARLVTLTGPGGCGKTRLAVETALETARDYPDGVWMVDLGGLSDPGLVTQAAASALRLREEAGAPLLEALQAHLKERRALLVMDNCEHLIDACARLVHALLSACPPLRVLATSREALQVPGEIVFPVPPLPLPDPLRPAPLPELLKIESIRLFVDRARSRLPDYSPTAQNAPDLVRICSRLDGIPLAIELAAAQMQALSVRQVADRLEVSLQLLAHGSRTAPARQQTLRATLDWSCDLLAEKEKTLLRRLSIFDGPFSLEAAESVCSGGEVEKAEVLELLSGLVGKSLVAVHPQGDREPRFRLLVTTRQYCREKLEAAGEEAALARRFLDYYASLVYEAEHGLEGSQQGTWVRRLELENDNLREALRFGLTDPPPSDQGLRMAAGLAQFWQLRGQISEGLRWVERAVALANPSQLDLRAGLASAAGFLAHFVEDFERIERYHQEALFLYQTLEDDVGVAWSFDYLAWGAERSGDLRAAQKYAEQSLPLHRDHADKFGASSSALCLGDVAYLQGDVDRAARWVEEAARLARETGNQWGILRRLVRLGQLRLQQDRLPEAVELLDEARRMAHESGDQFGLAMVYAAGAEAAQAQTEPERAAECIGAAQALLDRYGGPLWPVDRVELERCIQAVREALPEKAYETARKAGYSALEEGQEPAPVPATVFGAGENASHPVTDLQAAKAEYGGLTRREREVAALIARGKSNAEIAAELFVGVRTVEAHVTRILTRLGFTSRTQIAGWAVEKGLGKAASPESPQ